MFGQPRLRKQPGRYGVILMIVGAVAFVLSLIFWSSWGGFGTLRREHTVVSSDGYTRSEREETF